MLIKRWEFNFFLKSNSSAAPTRRLFCIPFLLIIDITLLCDILSLPRHILKAKALNSAVNRFRHCVGKRLVFLFLCLTSSLRIRTQAFKSLNKQLCNRYSPSENNSFLVNRISSYPNRSVFGLHADFSPRAVIYSGH